MYTSVKLRIEAKKRLDELQARLRLRGVKAGLHEILEKLIEIGLEEEEKLVDRFKAGASEEDPMLRLLEEPVDWGVEDSSVRVDEYLYGGGLGGVRGHGGFRGGEKQKGRKP